MKAYCQNLNLFEGVFMFPSFQKMCKEYAPDLMEGKILYYTDHKSGSQLEDEIITPSQGVGYALLLISQSRDLELIKEGINVIQTTQGSIILFYDSTNKWNILKLKEIMTTNKRKARVFYLKNKEPVSF